MRVHIDKRWDSPVVDIYVVEDGPRGSVQHVWKGRDEIEVVERKQGELMEPSLRLPVAVLAEIVAQSQDVLPPSAAVDRHLADVIMVRDRLLALVESPYLPMMRPKGQP